MRFQLLILLSLAGLLSLCCAKAKLSKRDVAILVDMLKGGDGYGQKRNDRAIRTPWTTILNGLLRSQNFASVAASIPCDIVNELENNAEAAEQFVREIQAGQVPTIIEDLPEEIINAFGSIVSVALSLPQSIWNTAVNVVDGVEDVFDSIADGSIVSKLPKEIADAWEDVTAGFVGAWDQATADIACFFGDCAKPTPGACDSSAVPMSAYASAMPVVHSNTTPAAHSYNWVLSSAVAAASASSSQSSQVYADGAVGSQIHGLIWTIAGMMFVGGLIMWL